MPAATIPGDETQRLAALHELRLLDTPAEERFDRLTRLATELFQVAGAQLNLIDAGRQYHKSGKHVAGTSVPRDRSFCAYTILRSGPLIVPDTRLDLRFADNPLAVAEPAVRFYAGVPLAASNGQRVGSLCLLDYRPRRFGAAAQRLLGQIAAMAQHEVNLDDPVQRRAHYDPLTGLANRSLFDDRLRHALAGAKRSHGTISVLFLDLDGFKAVNDAFGHQAGDRLLAAVAARIVPCLRAGATVARYGGDEFAVVLDEPASPAEAVRVARRIVARLEPPFELDGRSIAIGVSIGIATGRSDAGGADAGAQAARLLRDADSAMYRAKLAGRNQVALAGVTAAAVLTA